MYSILICGKSDEFNNILKTEINNLNIKYIYKIHIFDSKSSLADAIKIGIKCNLLIVDLEMDAEGECISLFRSRYKDSILACYSQHNTITADILKYNPYRLIIRSADRENIKFEIKELVRSDML